MPHLIGQSRDQAAKIMGAGTRYVQDAKKLRSEDPKAFAAGELTIPEVKREPPKKSLGEVRFELDRAPALCYKGVVMQTYSTREVAMKLGIHRITLQRYISRKLVPVPPLKSIGGGKFREWNKTNVEQVRKQLLKIKNGRRKKGRK